MSKRTDIHRPGAMIPAEYQYVNSYALPHSTGGWPCPALGIDCVRDRAVLTFDENGRVLTHTPGTHGTGDCCVKHMREIGRVFALAGSPGACDVCGTPHLYGDVWKHMPTGEYIVVGWICAAKYSLMVDRSEFELEMGRRDQAAAALIARVQNAEKRAKFLDENDGLEAALALKERHYILADLDRKLRKYHDLSPKQVALALKIASELTAPPKPEEKHVPAPQGRVAVEGEIVSVKTYDGFTYGSVVLKMVVKVQENDGCWLVFSTMPASLLNAGKGDRVRFTATLKPGRDAHFALGSRPTGGEIVAPQN